MFIPLVRENRRAFRAERSILPLIIFRGFDSLAAREMDDYTFFDVIRMAQIYGYTVIAHSGVLSLTRGKQVYESFSNPEDMYKYLKYLEQK